MSIKKSNPLESLRKPFSGTTLTEMLVVMIITGILFLLIFDGLNIVNKYKRILNNKLNQKSEILNGHQVLEVLLEKTDSMRKNENEILLFNAGVAFGHLAIDSTRILFYENEEHIDTLFTNLIDIRYHSLSEESPLIDSIFLSVPIGRDTIQLSYGLSPYSGLNLNNNLSYDRTE